MLTYQIKVLLQICSNKIHRYCVPFVSTKKFLLIRDNLSSICLCIYMQVHQIQFEILFINKR